MKLSTFLISAATAISLVSASPVSDPKATSPNVAIDAATSIFARDDDCQKCDEYFDKCKNSWTCWFNPNDCDRECRVYVCKEYIKCNNKCGFTCRPGDKVAASATPEPTPAPEVAEGA